MSDVLDFTLMDIQSRYKTAQTQTTDDEYQSWRDKDKNKDKTTLDFNDMLLLMVTQFQNQSIDNQADTSDMMNQLIQMTVMQAMTSMTTQMEELATANVMSYSASLVGKEVTLGVYDEKGNVTEKVGVVQGTGIYDGAQVIFVDGESYFLSSIMAVGRLPAKDPGEGDGDKVEGGDGTEGDDKTEETDKTEGDDKTEGSDSTEGAENSGAAGGSSGTAGSGENQNSGNQTDGETDVAGVSGATGS